MTLSVYHGYESKPCRWTANGKWIFILTKCNIIMYYRFLPILKAHSHIKTVSQLHGPPALPCNSYLRLCRCSVSKSRALPFTTKSGVAWPWVSVEPLSVGTLYHVIQSLLQTSRIYKHLQTGKCPVAMPLPKVKSNLWWSTLNVVCWESMTVQAASKESISHVW